MGQCCPLSLCIGFKCGKIGRDSGSDVFSIILFLLIGTILTMIVQASAATMAITLIMCANGWISLELGAALFLGENIGTTITANLAALTANTQAKREGDG